MIQFNVGSVGIQLSLMQIRLSWLASVRVQSVIFITSASDSG